MGVLPSLTSSRPGYPHPWDTLWGWEFHDPWPWYSSISLSLVVMVPIAMWGSPIVWVPDKFRSRKERGHSYLMVVCMPGTIESSPSPFILTLPLFGCGDCTEEAHGKPQSISSTRMHGWVSISTKHRTYALPLSNEYCLAILVHQEVPLTHVYSTKCLDIKAKL